MGSVCLDYFSFVISTAQIKFKFGKKDFSNQKNFPWNVKTLNVNIATKYTAEDLLLKIVYNRLADHRKICPYARFDSSFTFQFLTIETDFNVTTCPGYHLCYYNTSKDKTASRLNAWFKRTKILFSWSKSKHFLFNGAIIKLLV